MALCPSGTVEDFIPGNQGSNPDKFDFAAEIGGPVAIGSSNMPPPLSQIVLSKSGFAVSAPLQNKNREHFFVPKSILLIGSQFCHLHRKSCFPQNSFSLDDKFDFAKCSLEFREANCIL